MDKEPFKLLTDKNAELKIDKDLIELQKIIMYYGKKTVEELEKISRLIKALLQEKSNKELIVVSPEKPKVDTSKSTEELSTDPKIRYLQKLKIPKGYKGND